MTCAGRWRRPAHRCRRRWSHNRHCIVCSQPSVTEHAQGAHVARRHGAHRCHHRRHQAQHGGGNWVEGASGTRMEPARENHTREARETTRAPDDGHRDHGQRVELLMKGRGIPVRFVPIRRTSRVPSRKPGLETGMAAFWASPPAWIRNSDALCWTSIPVLTPDARPRDRTRRCCSGTAQIHPGPGSDTGLSGVHAFSVRAVVRELRPSLQGGWMYPLDDASRSEVCGALATWQTELEVEDHLDC